MKPLHRHLIPLALAALLSGTAFADTRVGVGQADAKSPVLLKDLQLQEPLVRDKYSKSPDLMRFLRATYSEACARGMLAKVTRQARLDPAHRDKKEAAALAAVLLDGKRVWKMTTFEMEALFKDSYLEVANYCDCLMLEVSDIDLANPQKGLEVLESLPSSRRNMCESMAKDQTQQQLRKYAPAKTKD